MNLVSYYILHTFKNSIKKIFKTWVAILIISIILISVIIGVSVAVISDKGDDTVSQQKASQIEKDKDEEANKMDKDDILAIVEMIAGGVVIIITLLSVAGGEKSGSKIFTMADVNFLFPSPRKPQSVLMFRVILQMGLILISSLYMIGQLPNLMLNAGLSGWNAIVILFAWFIVLIIGKLISVCTYTIVATYSNLRKFIRPIIYGVLLILLFIYLALISVGGMNIFDAAKFMFASKNTRWIPVWGWVRGIVMYSIEGNTSAFLMCLFAIILICAVFIHVIWHIKADFYEDALYGASEMQEKVTAMSEGRSLVLKRSKKIKSGEIGRGKGANVFLYKHLYNRKRSARFGLVTKTMETFFAICLGTALITKFVAKSENIMPLSMIMLYSVFLRSFKNPVAEESSKNFLFLVPESPFKKLFYSLLGGTIDSFFNILPGYFIAVVIIGGNISIAILWFLLFISVDFLTSCTALFIDMILPTYIAKAVRGMLLMILNMLCIAVIGVIVAVVAYYSGILEALIFSAILCISIGVWLCYLSQKMLHKGRN